VLDPVPIDWSTSLNTVGLDPAPDPDPVPVPEPFTLLLTSPARY